MFVSKKEHETLKDTVKIQDKRIENLMDHLINLQQEVNELKKPKKPDYFG